MNEQIATTVDTANLDIPANLVRPVDALAPKEGDKEVEVKFVQTPEDVCEVPVVLN